MEREHVQEKLIDMEQSVASVEIMMHDVLVGMGHHVRQDLADDEDDEYEKKLGNVCPTPSSTCSSRMSFEDMGDWAFQSTRSDLFEDEGSDVEWEIVGSKPQVGKPGSFSAASTPTSDEHESVTEGGILVAQGPPSMSSELLALDTAPTHPQSQLPDHWSTSTATRPNSPVVLHIEDVSKFCAQCLTRDCLCSASPSRRLSITPSDLDSITVLHPSDPQQLEYTTLATTTNSPPFASSRYTTPPSSDPLASLEPAEPTATTSSIEWPTLQEAMGLRPTRTRIRLYQDRSSVGSIKSRMQRRRERRSRVSELSRRRWGQDSESSGERGVGKRSGWDGVVSWW
jgi:hypothetical protein